MNTGSLSFNKGSVEAVDSISRETVIQSICVLGTEERLCPHENPPEFQKRKPAKINLQWTLLHLSQWTGTGYPLASLTRYYSIYSAGYK